MNCFTGIQKDREKTRDVCTTTALLSTGQEWCHDPFRFLELVSQSDMTEIAPTSLSFLIQSSLDWPHKDQMVHTANMLKS
jgi:hypothetical protein